MRSLVQFFGDGVRLGRWGLRFSWHWLRGIGLGIEWKEGIHREAPLVHSSIRIRLLFVGVRIEHCFTEVRPWPKKELVKPLDAWEKKT